MGALGLAFDGVLATALLWTAWQAIHAAGLFRAVVSFMVFGLLMALAWVRLEAPDIALAEAAIGAGITGALLLSALGRLDWEAGRASDVCQRGRDRAFWLPMGLLLLAGLGGAAWLLPAPGLGEPVAAELGRSGVENPVTAVLLNFRAFDTLLEIAILLLGVVVLWSLGPTPWPSSPELVSPALPALGRVLFPAFVLVSAYLLWRGSHAPGGAFPAGAVMGAGGVLMLLAGARPWLSGDVYGPWRWALALGMTAMLGVAFAVMVGGHGFFEYPVELAGWLILLLELAAGLSIALLLFALYLGGEPPADWDTRRPA
ncbi:multisubunit sodium/proton antiporter MrpB subunit [Thioalkalivibrio sp. ALE21]|uniref:hydrogenase subunit MbhD domain-containing protein n=1 Tax=Thioalkalivibrio sp. ALE21 TaxID=1158175 RepID=UPI000D943AF7|nr:hydrogenase subunit MbhD domain-containing protein [Thioalkalivibrio sp. ALE21]PYG04015.1 multisubunit sodium/proton antiporter MrpB subunit [Thioalkalivibrio sp. ALE21]